MPAFHRAGMERVNVFVIDDVHLFKHYFEEEAVFDELRRFYTPSQYRFEVPAPEFGRIKSVLADHGYALVIVDSIEPFAVAVRKYTAHPEDIFKASVLQRSAGDYNVFVLRDREEVDRTVSEGAVPLAEAPVESPFS